MSVYLRKCSRQECQGKKCKHKHFHYRFRINGVRYRGAITEAQTKWEADQAEVKIKRDVYDIEKSPLESENSLAPGRIVDTQNIKARPL